MEDIDPSGQQIEILPENSLKSIIEQQKHLFWRVPENKQAHLSIDAVVEAVLNNGNERLS